MIRLRCTIALLGASLVARVAVADPLTTLVVPTVPLSEEVPLALPPKVDELIGQALADRGALKVVSLARATASGGVIAGARDAAATLARAKAAYSAFRFADAVRDFDGLADLIEEAGSPPTDGEALTAALVGSAMANEAAGRPVAVKASCRRLMTLRPGYQLDRVRVPPSVVKACDTEAVELARAGKRSVVITSLPALAQVYVDGVLRGTTPLSIQVGVGRHGLIVAREDRLPFREVLVVEPGAEALRRSIDLKADPIPALARLQDALSQRGPLPHTLKLAVELARAASVEQILVLGVQPAGAGREGWRVLGAALPARGGTPTSRAGAVLDASLANASDVCGFLAERLAGVTEAVAMPPGDALGALEGFDFDGAIFGRAPQPAVAAAVSPIAPPAPVGALVSPAQASTPTGHSADPAEARARTRRRKIAIGVGLGIGLAVVAAGVTVGVLLGTRDTSPAWSFHVDGL